MIFTSVPFAVFFLAATILYYLLPGRFQLPWLLLAGVFFYMYSNPAYILIIGIIILVTYFAGIEIEKSASPKKAFQFYLAAIIINVGILVFFKYTNFFTSFGVDFYNFFQQKLFHSTSPIKNGLIINILVPLGISYITFQAIGYLIEIKRGNHLAEKNLGHLATFFLFFPKIVAGPVERAHHFLPQLKTPRPFNYNNISVGLKLILWGAFKKMVIADRIDIYTDVVLGDPIHNTGISIFIAAVLYVFQMYADFSGYTDMALGLAKMLGFDIMQNFNRPLLAKSVTEFWRKWHISLSTWFADYFYKPLAIEYRSWGNWAIVYAFFITFVVLGFWHGANWTFIIFGLLQGIVLTIEFFTRKLRKNIRKKLPPFLNTIFGIGFTFFYFAFSLVFFRADSVSKALAVIKRMHSPGPLYTENFTIIFFSFLGILFLFLVEIKKEYFDDLFSLTQNRYWIIRNCYYCFLVIVILAVGVFDGGEFIYFQF